ncbi:hypothetical protein HAX54_022020, partial [Datura stramonium]|nr:hypothetical protein [Datura stramonium]
MALRLIPLFILITGFQYCFPPCPTNGSTHDLWESQTHYTFGGPDPGGNSSQWHHFHGSRNDPLSDPDKSSH